MHGYLCIYKSWHLRWAQQRCTSHKPSFLFFFYKCQTSYSNAFFINIDVIMARNNFIVWIFLQCVCVSVVLFMAFFFPLMQTRSLYFLLPTWSLSCIHTLLVQSKSFHRKWEADHVPEVRAAWGEEAVYRAASGLSCRFRGASGCWLKPAPPPRRVPEAQVPTWGTTLHIYFLTNT